MTASRSVMQRFCRRIGIRLYRPSYRLLRGDPEKQAEAKGELADLRTKAQAGELVLLSQDEARFAMVFRPSRKLAMKLKVGRLEPLPLAEDPLADWSSHLFVANRVRYILLSNTRSLCSTAIYGRGVTDLDEFIEGVLAALEASLEADGVEDVYRHRILPSTGPVLFAGAAGRTVTGSMNELIASAKILLAEGGLSPFDLGVQLNEVLLSAIAGIE